MEIKKTNIHEIDTYMPENYVFISCSSYEGRCLSVANNIQHNRVKHALIAFNEDIFSHIKNNHEKLMSIWGDKAISISLHSNDPILTADNLKHKIETYITPGIDVIVDITTFTHESLLILIKLLSLVTKNRCNIKFIYTSAAAYGEKFPVNIADSSPNDGLDSIWLSKGISDVRNVLGFSGDIFSSRKTHIIILVGFEYERALGLINKYEPNYLTLGFGKTGGSISDKHQKANKIFHTLLGEMVSCPHEQFDFACNDPIESKKAIIKVAKKIENTNVVVAPMNTKISTLGAYLANLENDAVQICYAKPMAYNYTNYSLPGEHCYVIDLPEIFA